MNLLTAREIRLHLRNGQKHSYFQDGLSLIGNIQDDTDPDIFRRQGIIRNPKKVISNYQGNEVVGMVLQPNCMFDYFFERERTLGIVVTEIGCESSNRTPHDYVPAGQNQPWVTKPIINRRIAIFTELEFDSGLKVFLEFCQVPETGIDELAVINHIYSHSSLCCRRLGGGLSIWNTDHILKWTNFPHLEMQQGIGVTSSPRESKGCTSVAGSLQLI